MNELSQPCDITAMTALLLLPFESQGRRVSLSLSPLLPGGDEC